MTDCPICNGRGIRFDDNGKASSCICVIQNKVKSLLPNKLKDIPYLSELKVAKLDDITLALRQGTYNGFLAITKALLVYHIIYGNVNSKADYDIITAVDILESYLDDNYHTIYYEPKFLFLDLTKHYTNRATGDVVKYVLDHRHDNKKQTFIYVGDLLPVNLSEMYGDNLSSHIGKLPVININEVSEGVEKCIKHS